MKVLVDTNILLWILFDESKLKSNELKIINNSENEIILSGISFLEISLKYSLNKLELNNIKPDEIPDIMLANGYEIEDIDFMNFASLYKLASSTHKDPFDRLIIWEAIRKDYYLMSRDSEFKEYLEHGLKLIRS
jgi:PIN domain nuclease of toxin-antitoxin system